MANERRTYTDADKQQALRIYAAEGPRAAAEQTGLPYGTIRKWAQRAGVTGPRAEQTRAAVEQARASFQVKREALREELLDAVRDLVARIYEPHVEFVGKDGRREELELPSGQSAQSYMTAAAIGIDKLRLELGEATSRSEEIRKDRVDTEIERLLEQMSANGNGNGHARAGA